MEVQRRHGLELPGALQEVRMTVVCITMHAAPFDDLVTTVLMDRRGGGELAAEAARETRREAEGLDVLVDKAPGSRLNA